MDNGVKHATENLLFFYCFLKARKSYDVRANSQDVQKWLTLCRRCEELLNEWAKELGVAL